MQLTVWIMPANQKPPRFGIAVSGHGLKVNRRTQPGFFFGFFRVFDVPKPFGVHVVSVGQLDLTRPTRLWFFVVGSIKPASIVPWPDQPDRPDPFSVQCKVSSAIAHPLPWFGKPGAES